MRMKMPCAKSCLNWSRNVGGVAKIQFCGLRDLAKNIHGRKWAWPMPKDATDSREPVDIKVLTVGGSLWEL